MSIFTPELLKKLIDGLAPVLNESIQGLLERATDQYALFAADIAREAAAYAFAKAAGDPEADKFLKDLEAQVLLLAQLIKIKEGRELRQQLGEIAKVAGQVMIFVLKALL